MATGVPSFVAQQPRLVQESCRNELTEPNAPEHLSTSSGTQVRACRRSAHRDAYRKALDLHIEEGVIGRSYLEPYISNSMRYLIPALYDLGEMFKGRGLAPIEF